MILSKMTFVDEYFKEHFVINVPEWHVVGTIIFVLFFSFTLFVQRWYKASQWNLRKNIRAFKRIEKDNLMDASERDVATQAMLTEIASAIVPERSGRIEPRMARREWQHYPSMKMTRTQWILKHVA